MPVAQTPVHYCEDCKFFVRKRAGFHMCKHPKAHPLNMVTRNKPEAYCSVQREYGKCGLTGIMFEEREVVRVPIPKPWWRRLLPF